MKDTEQARMLLSMARKDMSALQGMTDSEIFAEEMLNLMRWTGKKRSNV